MLFADNFVNKIKNKSNRKLFWEIKYFSIVVAG